MYETTGDLNEQHYYASLDADMEMWEMRQESLAREADRARGVCWHDSGVLYRETAFYPEQIDLSPGQMHCYDCKQDVATDSVDCFFCGLDKFNCMGERGYRDHKFVPVPMVAVCNRMEIA
jgi:hypothetical protein